MKTSIFFFFLLLCNIPSIGQAQWVKLFQERNWMRSVYFMDEQGKSNIGYVGMYRTTDGGSTWLTDQDPDNTDFTFKDDLIGWYTTRGGIRNTTDGGITWFGGSNPAQGVSTYFDHGNGGLFVGGFGGPDNMTSWDDAKTWIHWQGSNTGFAFSTDSLGLIASNDGNFWQRTTDGGHNWRTIAFDSECWQPLALKGTKTFYAITDNTAKIYRTTDAGDTWNNIFTFPPSAAPAEVLGYRSSGCIRGDSARLIVQLITGCYISLDQGLSWKSLCGPVTGGNKPSDRMKIADRRFYLNANRLYVATCDSSASPPWYTLWYLNLDSLTSFNSHLQEVFIDGSKRWKQNTNAVTVQYNTIDDPLIGIDSVHLSIRYDRVIDLKTIQMPSGWRILDSSTNSNVLNLWITSNAQPLPKALLSITYATALEKPSGKIYLDSAHFYGKRLNCDCAALSVAGPDSVEIDFTGCGDSTLLRFMSSGSLVGIDRVTPNPAGDFVRVEGRGFGVNDVEVYDMMGRQVSITQPHPLENGVSMDVRTLPDGIYYVRIGLASARFEILR